MVGVEWWNPQSLMGQVLTPWVGSVLFFGPLEPLSKGVTQAWCSALFGDDCSLPQVGFHTGLRFQTWDSPSVPN